MSGEAMNAEKKFPHESRMAQFQCPMIGLAGGVKYKFPTSGVAASGEFIFHPNC